MFGLQFLILGVSLVAVNIHHAETARLITPGAAAAEAQVQRQDDVALSMADRSSIPIISLGGSIPEPVGGGVPATPNAQYYANLPVSTAPNLTPSEYNKVFEKDVQDWNKEVSNAQQAVVANLNGGAGAFGTGGPSQTFSSNAQGYQGFNGAGAPIPGTGSQGTLQTANNYPKNNQQNIFAQPGGIVLKPGETKFYNVQTSSVASSVIINGQKSSYKKAQIIVNDNGKISTYNLGDP